MKKHEEKRFDDSGSSFDSFLAEDNLLSEAEAVAIKRVIAWQLKKAMKQKSVTKVAMARRLGTSRSQVDRLLNPTHVGVTIGTLARAASAVGKHLRFDIVEKKGKPRSRGARAARPGHRQPVTAELGWRC